MMSSVPACPHRPPCPACPRFGDPGISAATAHRLDALASGHGLSSVPVIEGALTGFRHRARLAIRGRRGAPKIGLFELDSHRVVHVPRCVIHHPLINQVADTVRRSLAETGVTCYSDAAHLGVARYLQVVVERSTQSAQVVVIANADDPELLAPALNLIRERLGGKLHSLWINFNRARTNAILGPAFQRRCGPDSIVERFGGPDVHYPPGAFGQSNLEIADAIVSHVRERVPDGSRVVEYYAGVGAIGLSLLDRVRELRMNEVGLESLRGLDLGLAGLEPGERARISVIPGPAAQACDAADGADVVIVDPPRKGLDPALTLRLAERPPQRLLYVSCGLDSLLHDAAALVSTGRLQLTSLSAFNLMPFTEHVETVACFDRR